MSDPRALQNPKLVELANQAIEIDKLIVDEIIVNQDSLLHEIVIINPHPNLISGA